MISLLRFPAAMTYRVEVSGWDAEQNYFVTKAQLQWHDDNGKHVILSRKLVNHALVFVRLLPFTESDRALPVPYHVEYVESASEGLHKFRLHAVRAKVSHDLEKEPR